MPDLDSILSVKLIEASVLFDPDQPDSELHFNFDVNKITPNWFDAQRQGLEAGEILTVASSLAEVIHAWNLTSGDQPVPADAETLSRFPMGHLNLLMETIAEQPTRAEGEGSRSTSATPLPSSLSEPASPPNGREPSQSPRPSESLPTR